MQFSRYMRRIAFTTRSMPWVSLSRPRHVPYGLLLGSLPASLSSRAPLKARLSSYSAGLGTDPASEFPQDSAFFGSLPASAPRLSSLRSRHSLNAVPLCPSAALVSKLTSRRPDKCSRTFPSKLRGDKGVRTLDPLLAKQVLSQLSYTPVRAS